MHIEDMVTLRLVLHRRVWQCLFLFAMVALLVLSLIPPSPNLPSTGWDKSNHALGFVVLFVLAHLGWPRRQWTTVLGLFAYGGLIEALQSLTSDRFAEFGDLAADGVGIVIGKGLTTLYVRLASARV